MGQIKYNLGNLANDFYSTTETVVGQWIDGKPIYRIVLETTIPTCVTNGTAVTTIYSYDSNIDVVTSIRAIYYRENNYYWSSGYTAVSGSSIVSSPVYYNTTSRGIIMANNSTGWNGSKAYVILEYTKTTD